MSTPYHAAYYAHELTRRSSSDSLAKFGASLFNATVDLNPHQLDAALFAFKSPLSRGAMLADEVGLGKTIEAGLIISQLWAEHKRRILIITPATLRKQWAQEMTEKFHRDSVVLETREMRAMESAGSDPFHPGDRLIICSYQFAAAQARRIQATPWNLIVIDEAHRLRNVYKGAKIATTLKKAVYGNPLVLLTATPLQNHLLELYGLVSFIDEHVFGDIETFKIRYTRGAPAERELGELKLRLKPLCQRTLRRQVQEYVRFTRRISQTQDFTPTREEQALYDRVSDYLQREKLYALPASQRKLITMVLRKLLASSSHAVAETLRALAERLENSLTTAQAAADALPVVEQDFETAGEEAEEWDESDPPPVAEPPADSEAIRREIEELRGYSDLAATIDQNAKGQALLSALNVGFSKLAELGAKRKAVLFTESRRTQEYLRGLLHDNGYDGKVITINGTNADDSSGRIYREWTKRHAGDPVVTGNKNVDLRAAIVEEFRERAEILIATEAAAEGVNLQFCSLVINYDLPWNPQRIEQRIGRCHRYGQKYDVVVFNFLNRANEADQRVFELLSEKFQLFDGLFGSSDEVLGALESGVDFERRIAEIYQNCRTREEIDAAFAALRSELEVQIQARMASTRSKLLEHFDEEVRDRLRLQQDERDMLLKGLERSFWNLTRYELRDAAQFTGEEHQFVLRPGRFSKETCPPGLYEFRRRPGEYSPHAQVYRPDHPLGLDLIARAQSRSLPVRRVVFNYRSHGEKIGLIENQMGRRGWARVSKLSVSSREPEDLLLCAVMDQDGKPLPSQFGEKMFEVAGEAGDPIDLPSEVQARLDELLEAQRTHHLDRIAHRNRLFFDAEMDKLERWAEDRKFSLEIELKELDALIKQAGKEARSAALLEDKLAHQGRKRELEAARAKKRRELFEAEDEVDRQKEKLIDDAQALLKQSTSEMPLFTLRWEIV